MSPRNVASEQLDLGSWPEVNTSELTEAQQRIVEKRVRAITLYVGLVPVNDITRETGVCRTEIFNLFNRALKIHSDGSIWGFRVCLLYQRVKRYTRTGEVAQIGKSHGHSGELVYLFARYPAIEQELTLFALGMAGASRRGAARKLDIFRKFIQLCKSYEVTGYPFTTKYRGYRSIVSWTDACRSRHHRISANTLYAKNISRKLGFGEPNARHGISIFQRVEFDGHKIDAIFAITVVHPDGSLKVIVLKRLWLLVVRDVASKAVLSFYISLNEEYSAEDVLTCVELAIQPWSRPALTIPNLKYLDEGGIPSEKIPELQYAVWGEFAFDNARANLSPWVLDRIQNEVGCCLNPGALGKPDERLIEGYFKVLAENSYQRLPNTTGSCPKDTRRDGAEENAMRFEMNYSDLQEVTAVMVSDLNGRPNSGLAGRSPLEHLEFLVKSNQAFITTLPEEMREGFCLTQKNIRCTIRGNVKKGRMPYVQYLGVHYTCSAIACSPSFVGKKVLISVHTKDLRTVKCFHSDGAEIGTLVASGGWSVSAHDERIRKAINDLKRSRIIEFYENEDPVEVYKDYLEKRAKKNKKAALRAAAINHSAGKSEVRSNSLIAKAEPSPVMPKQYKTMKDFAKFKGVHL